MAFPYFYLGLALGGLTLIGVPYLRHRFGLERTQQVAYAYLTVGFSLYLATTILFEGLFGFELLPDVPDKLGGLMMFPALALIIFAGITFLTAVWKGSASDSKR